MTFSGCGSYRKETCGSDQCKVTVYNIYIYVLNNLMV